MKNILILSVLLITCLKSLMIAQKNIDDVLISEKYKTSDGVQEWKYTYDSENSVILLEYIQHGKLFYTENGFKKEVNGRISSFTRTYSNGKTPTETHFFEYYPDGKLWKHYYTKVKNGKTLTAGSELQWEKQKAVELTGNPLTKDYYNKTIYLLDENGNITKRQSYFLNNGTEKESGAPTIYGDYDHHINPRKLRKNYVNEHVISANNPQSEFTEAWSFGTAKLSYQYNDNGLPISSKTTFHTKDYSFYNRQTFTYKTATSANKLAKIFSIAKSVNANTIQQMKYDGTDVYLIINTFYSIDGAVQFKVIPGEKRVYEPAINKDLLKMGIGKWIKDKNGNYTAIK